jgi:hypothetical protein
MNSSAFITITLTNSFENQLSNRVRPELKKKFGGLKDSFYPDLMLGFIIINKPNGMISLTFAAFKHGKDSGALKQQIAKRHELAPTSFKALIDLKDRGISKRLDNQENTQASIHNQPLPRKNIVKVDKSNKKYHKGFKSPLSRNWEVTQSSQNHAHGSTKPLQQSIHQRTQTSRTEDPVMMTPSITKTNRSFIND